MVSEREAERVAMIPRQYHYALGAICALGLMWLALMAWQG